MISQRLQLEILARRRARRVGHLHHDLARRERVVVHPLDGVGRAVLVFADELAVHDRTAPGSTSSPGSGGDAGDDADVAGPCRCVQRRGDLDLGASGSRGAVRGPTVLAQSLRTGAAAPARTRAWHDATTSGALRARATRRRMSDARTCDVVVRSWTPISDARDALFPVDEVRGAGGLEQRGGEPPRLAPVERQRERLVDQVARLAARG